jgi:hypothetical protein
MTYELAHLRAELRVARKVSRLQASAGEGTAGALTGDERASVRGPLVPGRRAVRSGRC